MRIDKCPSKVEFAQAVGTEPSPLLEAHLKTCPRCAKEWEREQQLLSLAADMPKHAVSSAKAAKMHDALLEKAAENAGKERVRRRPAAWLAVAAVLALIGSALVLGLPEESPERGGSRVVSAPEVVRRATIHPLDDAEYRLVSAQPDEIVRLSNGTVTVSVDKLNAGERFRIIAGDAEVEVVGTVFEVAVVGDRLSSVRVLSGTVEVRPVEREAAVLDQGERWQADLVEPAPEREAMAMETPPKRKRPRPIRASKRRNLELKEAIQDALATDKESETRREDENETGSEGSVVETAFNNGWSRFRQGDFSAAAAAFDKAMHIEEESSLKEDAAYWRAVALLRAGDSVGAKSAMKQYLAIYPNSQRAAEISTRLGWLTFEAGRKTEAKQYFEAGLKSSDPKVKRSAENGLDALDK